jgi:hypothetical protein
MGGRLQGWYECVTQIATLPRRLRAGSAQRWEELLGEGTTVRPSNTAQAALDNLRAARDHWLHAHSNVD